MATGTFGHIRVRWQQRLQYEERLGHFFVANGIDDAEKKQAAFLSLIGASTYKLLHNLIYPSRPGEKTYTELTQVLSRHFNPTPSVIVKRFRFHSRFRKPGESAAQFVSELRCLSQFCEFGDTLEDMLRDRLVCSIDDGVGQIGGGRPIEIAEWAAPIVPVLKSDKQSV